MILLILKKYFILILDLLKNKIVKTSKLKPTTNLKDVFNKDLRTFCYNGIAEKHLGIYFYNRVAFNSDEVNFFSIILYFI